MAIRRISSKSVQYGTATITASGSSGTAAISPVTNAPNTASHYLGQSQASATISFTASKAHISLSGTTLTAAVAGTALGNIIVAFCEIEYQGTCLTANAVQNVSAASSASVTSYTAPFTTVTLANTITFFGGWTIATETTSESLSYMNGALTGVATLTVSINGAASVAKTFNVSIAEFNSGVLNSAVQRGTTTLSGSASTTAALSPGVVLGNSAASYLGNTSSAAGSEVGESEIAIALTSSFILTITKATAAGSTSTSWEVYEFPAFANFVETW